MFKNLKSLFVVEEENSNKMPSSDPQQGKAGLKEQPASKITQNTTPATGSSEPGKAVPELTEVLFKAMEQNNVEGFDYLEFKQSLNSLKKMPMDEQTRYQSAYAMAQTMGVTVERLLQTGQHYLDVLKQEEQKFETAVNNQKAKQIGEKEQHILKLEESIKAKAEQIKQLTVEIEADQAKAKQMKQEMTEASVKVETTRSNFVASYEALVQQIRSDLDNIKNFLK
ncbi:MAG: hypothetical protein SH848_07755 [Saprospiraceae bacterium]|nr:hypothetical protein [Saprospiraceae bacterium]MDZ4703807.1 hypothetical protein [Saprospiraceae bacterium]